MAAESLVEGPVRDARAVDISFVFGGVELEPADGCSVLVRLRTPLAVAGEEHSAIHLRDDGAAEVVAGATAHATAFAADEFSVYAIVGESGQVVPRVKVAFLDAQGNDLGEAIVREDDTLVAPDAPPATEEGAVFDAWYSQPTGAGATPQDMSGYLGVKLEEELFAQLVNLGAEGEEEGLFSITAKAAFRNAPCAYFYQNVYGSTVNAIADTVFADADGNVGLSQVGYNLNDEEAYLQGWELYKPTGEKVASYGTDGVVSISQDTYLYPRIVHGYWVRLDAGKSAETGEDLPVVASVFAMTNDSGNCMLTSADLPTDAQLGEKTFYPGYKLEGWYTDEGLTSKVGAGTGGVTVTETQNRTLYAKWEPRTDTAYTLRYMVEGPEGKPGEGKYTFLREETRTGTTGATIPNNPGTTISSYDFNETKTAQETVKIAADGTAIKNVYYNRQYWNVRFTRASNNSELISRQSIKWGEPLEVFNTNGALTEEMFIDW